MKIAAIDIGSNSIHMVVVEVAASGGFAVIEREKEMVRLGAGTLSRGMLSAAAMKRGLAVLSRYKQLARNHRVDKLVAVATSAVREARNGEDFLEQVGRETGIWPRVASGEGEARLIYLAALHSIHLEGKRALVVDIGGGSLELALGAGRRLEWAVSEKLGVLRMTERFVKSDPLAAKDEGRLEAAILKALLPHVPSVRQAGFECAIGTSGTILALGAMAHHLEHGLAPETLHHLKVGARTLHELRKQLVASNERERLRLLGLDARRADLLVAGAVLLDTVLDRLGVEELTLCEWALREGILLDYIDRHPRSLARAEAIPDPRTRSVIALAERCQFDEPHARHVAALSVALFDQTRERHGLGERERSLLEYAALLHDIGHHISYPGHHKHTYYLIKNAGLRGFDPLEIELLASVARYHRRGHPRRRHTEFGALPRPARRTVRVLAGLLRVADALDRSHRQTIRTLSVAERGGVLKIRGEATGDCELELWGVPRRTALLEEVLELSVRIEVVASAKSGPARIQAARA
jgi:exopolyphosphatase/guanosine-5'-triphosphate,3'-diphosphate pyrophosphatase